MSTQMIAMSIKQLANVQILAECTSTKTVFRSNIGMIIKIRSQGQDQSSLVVAQGLDIIGKALMSLFHCEK